MKNKIFTAAATAVTLLFAVLCVGCDALHKGSANRGVTIQGAPYEVVVVCNTPTWDGPAGDTLRRLLRQPVPALNQTEPMFDVLRVLPEGFKNIIARHRNIIKMAVKPSAEPSMGVQYDVTAHPQTVIHIQAPDQKSLAEFIGENGKNLLYVLEKSERDRTLGYASKYYEAGLRAAIEQEFGIRMNIPKGYMLRNRKEDFLWASYELPNASQGFFIYSYPYKGVESLSAEALTRARNKFAALIPGPSDGSYMTTYTEIEPLYKPIRIDGRLWIEMRGLWDVANDFMGGPYVSYSTVDTETDRVITLDCYVYSPQQPKRNYMHALEHLVYLVEFPTQNGSASE